MKCINTWLNSYPSLKKYVPLSTGCLHGYFRVFRVLISTDNTLNTQHIPFTNRPFSQHHHIYTITPVFKWRSTYQHHQYINSITQHFIIRTVCWINRSIDQYICIKSSSNQSIRRIILNRHISIINLYAIINSSNLSTCSTLITICQISIINSDRYRNQSICCII